MNDKNGGAKSCGNSLDVFREDNPPIVVPEVSKEWSEVVPMVSSTSTIRISHQPNFLAYWKLIGQFVAADKVRSESLNAHGVEVPIIFVMNDYDAWRDERVRRAEFPVLRSSPDTAYYLNIRPRDKTPSEKLYYFLGPVDEEFYVYLRNRIQGYLAGFREILPVRTRSRFSRVTREITEEAIDALRRSESWTEFSVVYFKYVFDKIGIQNIEFVSGYEKIRDAQESVWQLATVMRDASDEDLATFIWAVCDMCKCRFRIPHGSSSQAWECGRCGRVHSPDNCLILPKVVLDNLMDDVLYPDSICFSHSGSISHIARAHRTRLALGIEAKVVDVVSDQGARADANFPHVIRAAASRAPVNVDYARVREVYDAGRLGSYSSLYYLIGDSFENLS